MQCTWQLLTKIDIQAQVEPAVEPALPVVSDPMRLARRGSLAVRQFTDRGELGAPRPHQFVSLRPAHN
jgi:hypothetical protein